MENLLPFYFQTRKTTKMIFFYFDAKVNRLKTVLTFIILALSNTTNGQVMSKGMAVVTRYSDSLSLLNHPPALIIDARNNLSAPTCCNWNPLIGIRIFPTSWTKNNLGQVFGTAIDKNFNVYLAASDVYTYDNNALPSSYGPSGSAAIYMASSANLNNLTTIVNTTNSGSISLPSNSLPNTGGIGNGIGNIAYDLEHHQMFATNLEDGRIYRVNLNTNQVLSSYDPFGIDAGAAGMPVVSERLWGIGINKDPLGNSRIYFAREPVGNSPHEIWSIPLNNSGEFIGSNTNQVFYGSEIFEVFIPNSNLSANSIYHNKITDLAFSSDGVLMLTAERGNPKLASTYQYKVGSFVLIRRIPTGGSIGYPDMNSAGGVDFGYREGPNGYYENCDTMIWASANQHGQPGILFDLFSCGIIGFNTNSGLKKAVVDFENSISTGMNDPEVGKIGDVEVAREPCKIVNYSLACDDHIQVSLDSNCCAIITPDMVLEGNYPLNCLKVLLKDKYGNVIPSSPKICNQFIGQLISYSLVDTCTGNSCWGTLVVEDKLPPKITCQNPDTVFCNNTGFNWTPPPGVDNCGGVVKTIVISDVTTKMPCDSFCIAQRKVTYYYQDQYGNRSDTCMKIICYKKINFSDIVWPRDTVFSCEMWDTIPPPSTSGVPMAGGYPIYPDWHLCKMAVTYEDLLIPICPKSFKVLRTWTVIDWCKSSPNNVYKYYQVIKVIDDRGPIVVCSPDLTVSTDIWSCTGTAIIAPPRVIRECSKTTLEVGYKIVDKHGVPTYEGTSKNNIIKLPNGYYSISGLPLGLSWVVFHVTDECGNSTDCYTEVTVADMVPPIAVCDQKTVVSLTIDGTAKIEAITFDDGSLDNCMIDRFEVKRMDDGIPCNTINGNQWGPYVFFCCADLGKTIMVSLRVWDKAGNSNTCMVEVQVQDKIPPVIFCPPHITVSCEFDYADLSVFGTVVTDFNLRKPIQINDPKVKHSGPLLDGYAYDGCGAVVKELTPIYNLTCNRGTITRTFEATDISGLKSICTQIITIQDLNPNNVTVKWPVDFLSNSNCTSVPKLQPDVTGKPIVSGADKCNQIMITHEDQIFTLEPDACIKILRKWTIIDWCIYQANNPATGGYWTWTQIIKVSNTVAPTFTSSCVDRNIDVYGPGCGGNISLVGTAKDDCTDSADLVWYHSVDLYNDGLSPGIEYLRSGPGADASGTYPVGKHRITYFVKDGCNNETRCSFVITVVDAKKPTPYCNSSITTTIMPSTKAISIWAKDFNINSEDNCTSKENLKYYFLINNIKLPSLNLDCSNIGLNKIRMYVEDEAGNSDYCEVTLDLQDPNKVCGGTFLRASGNMTTPDGKVMPKGKLTAINSNTGSSQESEVQANGNYSFNDLTKGGSYRIKSTYNEDPLNGVSTQDIVLIQKHILGQQILDSPYKYIAADANNSGSISAADISEIRKLILGIIPKFNQNESWRFIPKGYVFQNKNKPFPFEEEIQHQNITTNCLNDDFYAVKIGDINGNVNLFNTAATRALNSYTIEVENKTIPSKENVRIPIYASQDMSIIGIQLALQLSKGLKISAIEPGALPIQSEQYVKNQNDLVLSFANNNAIQVKPGEVLFYVDVINESMEDIYSEVQINSNKLNAEVYDASTNAYTIKMHVRHNSDQETKLQLFQNVPNPFRDKTYIQFLSSSTEEVKIQIIGLDGRLQYEKVVGNSFSIQNIEIDESILSHSGVYLVKLSSRNETASIKIVKFN